MICVIIEVMEKQDMKKKMKSIAKMKVGNINLTMLSKRGGDVGGGGDKLKESD
jgi:hypothetical protein